MATHTRRMNEEGAKNFFCGLLLTLFVTFIFISTYTYYTTTGQGSYRCIKTYTISRENSSSKRVDLQDKSGETITLNCSDIPFMQYNSADIYAHFEPNQYYYVEYVGYRNPFFSIFPTVTRVIRIKSL